MPRAQHDRAEATVIAPAFNEEEALPVVLAALAPLREQGIDVVIVDDGSTDRTAEVARAAGFTVVHLERNSGKAAAVRAGLATVTTEKVIVMDADATYPAAAIPQMIRLLDETDVVIGIRTTGREHIPALNRLGNGLIRTAVHWFSGFRSADPLTGLYGLRREHLEAMRLDSDGFGLEVEIGVKAARMGLRWIDHPIAYGERIGASKLNAVRDGLVITSTLIRTLFRRPRLRPLPGRDGVPAAPLATLATVLCVSLLAAAAVLLTATCVIALAAIVEPTIPFTLSPARPGLVALVTGLVLWRTTTHWGRPPPRALLRLAAGSVAGAAAAVVLGSVLAQRMGVLSADPRMDVAVAAVVVSGAVVGGAGLLVLAASALGWRPALGPGRLAARTRLASSASPLELIALGGIVVLLAIPVARFISLGQHLGFDESIYAATARSWVLGTPNSAWSADRPPGISVLGLPGALAGSDVALRLVGLAFAAGAVVAGWALARRLGGAAAGLLAALLIATIPGLQLNGALFLTDVPSATMFLVLMLAIWRQLEEPSRPERGLLWLAPLAAAVFYLRYGASVPILFLALTAVLLWGRRLVEAWKLTLATAALLLVLLAPHLLQSWLVLGSPFAIALSAQSLASPAYPGEALVRYWQMLPSELAGVIGAWSMVLGVIALPVRIWARGLDDRTVRAHAFLVIPALGQFVLLGIVALPQVRYVLLPIMLLLIAGSLTAVELGTYLSRAWRRTLALGLAVGIVVGGIGSAAVMIRLQAEVTPASAHLVDAAEAIEADAAGAPCSILGYPPPQLVWYSGCAALHFGYPPVEGRGSALTGERRYLLLSTIPTDREPAGALREDYLRLAEPSPMAVVANRVTGEPAYEIYRIVDPR